MAEFFVRRPIVAMVIAIIIVIVGFVAMSALPVAQYPEITPPQVSVTANYTGANAVAVEESVATPVEQKVNGVENMIYMKSTNASSGSMQLQVSFEVGTDLDMANVLTQNRVSEAQALLPEEVKRLGVTVKKQLSFPLLLISLISPNGTYDEQFLTNYTTINILDEIARIRGVGQAEVAGGSAFEYAMRVWIKPDQLAKLGLTVPDITAAIREHIKLRYSLIPYLYSDEEVSRLLEAAGAPIIGTSPDSIDLAEDRERFQKLVEELGHVLELAVHAGEAHVRHLVQLAQLLHDQFADDARRDFALTHRLHRMNDSRD